MLIYILKSTCILAILLMFYKTVLERETIHVFKRFYLLASVLIAILIPAITFTSYIEATTIIVPLTDRNNNIDIVTGIVSTNYLEIVLWSIYGLGVLFFGIRFLFNLSQILIKVHYNERIKSNTFIHVLIKNLTTPHTFFNYIFFNQDKYRTKQIPEEVKIHEQTHAEQLHSVDVVFIELLCVIFWFNPLIYLLKNSIKLNHEFLADKAVLKSGVQLTSYQNTLLEHSYTHNTFPIANAINYSSIKKRFKIMKTKTPPKISWLKSSILLPLLAILIYGFSEKQVIEKEPVGQNQINGKSYDSHKNLINNKDQKFQSNQDKATPEQLAEYNKLAKHYNDMSKNEMVVKSKDVKRLKYIYSLMTKEQKASAEPFPNFPPPPPPPPMPSKDKIANGSKELKKLSKIFYDKTDAYLKASKKYFKTKENYGKLKSLYDETMVAYKNFAKKAKEEKIMAPPPPPPIPQKGASVNNPTYKEYITEMNSKGGRFFFEKNEVSYKKALALKSTYGKINMLTQSDNNKPMVFLSRNEITIEDIKINEAINKELSSSDISKDATNKDTLHKAAEYYINGKRVSYEKVKTLDVNSIKKIDVKKNENKKGAVYITLK